ncbi:coiled-coil domain-containing protein 189 [Huso huso]|uniref:Coiled-coil domain-containing protein 189 n=1 Tax=Huso huso TaxID=61971 RepID=A0ABR0Y510_HUSHU
MLPGIRGIQQEQGLDFLSIVEGSSSLYRGKANQLYPQALLGHDCSRNSDLVHQGGDLLLCPGQLLVIEGDAKLLSRAVHVAVKCETPLANEQHCFQYFSELLLCHSVRRPPFSVDLFSAEQVKMLAEFVINTYFRHFKLYKYMFTPQVRLDVTLSYTGMSEETVVQEDEEQKPSSSPEPSSEEQSPDTAPVEEQGPSPRAELRQYIQSELSAEVSRLQASVEEKLRLNAEALSSKLAQLEERSAGQRDKSHKGKKK